MSEEVGVRPLRVREGARRPARISAAAISLSREGGRAQGLTRRELLSEGRVGAAAVARRSVRIGRRPPRPQTGRQAASSRARCGCSSLGVEFPIPDIAKQASKDLGFTVKPILADSEKQPQIAITSPDTFDVFGGYNYQSLLVWPSGGLQPVDTRKIPSWNSVLQAVRVRQAQPGVGQLHVR